MRAIELKPLPLTRERFAPYGDVIEAAQAVHAAMNDARFERFDDLATVDVGASRGGEVAVSIARCRTPTGLPYRIEMVERHPLGSQAFVPLGGFSFVVVVGPRGEAIDARDLRAFVTNGRQGINYRKGTWHLPLIAFEAGREFLVIDRKGKGANCDQVFFSDPVLLLEP